MQHGCRCPAGLARRAAAPAHGVLRPARAAVTPRPRTPSRRAGDAVVRALYRAGFPLLKLWWRLTHPTLHGVYVAVWHEGCVLLVRNSYRSFLTFPCGRRSRGEPPARAACRELREEVGIAARPEDLRAAAEYRVSTALVEDHVHVFELALPREPALALDHREVVWGAFTDPEEALARDLALVVRRYLAEQRDGVIPPVAAAAERRDARPR